MPELTRCILQEKKGIQVGKGKAFCKSIDLSFPSYTSRSSHVACWLIWIYEGTNVHVNDLSDCYLKLIEAAVSGGGKATWGKEGYYLTENGTHVWGDMSKVVATEAHKQGLIPSAEVVSLSAEEAGQLTPFGFLLWGANSRGTAIRARQLLDWSPKGKSIEAETPELVKGEAKRLGLVQGHAAQVAG